MSRLERFIFVLLLGPAAGALYAGTPLTAGVPTNFSMTAASGTATVCGGGGFQIDVPANASRLEIRAATSNLDAELSVLIRYGQGLDCSNATGSATYIAGGTPVNSDILRVVRPPELQPGTYYIGFQLNPYSNMLSGTILATVDLGPQDSSPGKQLASGVSAAFVFGANDNRQLYSGTSLLNEYGYKIVVPSGATRLQVNLSAVIQDGGVSLFVRLGTPVTPGSSGADYSAAAPGGAQTLTITPSASKPLQAGAYYIALRVDSVASFITGSIIATVDVTPPPPPPIVTILTSGAGQSVSLPAATTPTLFHYRITLPAGASRLDISLQSCAPPDAEVDVYVRPGTDFDQSSSTLGSIAQNIGSGCNKTLSVPSSPFAPLQGDYYIALQLIATGTAVTGTLSATFFTAVPVPAIDVSTNTLDFGLVLFGQSKDLPLTLRNVGQAPLTVSSISSSSSQFTVNPPGAPFVLTPGGQQAVTIHFTPSSVAVQTATLTIGSDDPTPGRDKITVVLQGVGVSGGTGGPVISVLPSLDFGSAPLGQTKDQSLTIGNPGGATLTVRSLAINVPQFSVISPAAPFNVAPSAQQAVVIRFTPSAAGAQAGTLLITSNDPGNSNFSVSLTGSGQQLGGPPTLSASVTTLAFTTQAGTNPAQQTFTIRNVGGGTLVYQISVNQPWLSVSPAQGSSTGGANTITVSVNVGSLVAGTYSGQIQISASAGPALSREPDPSQAGPVVIAVQLTVTPSPTPTPIISQSGVVNAATFANPALPNGAIARGSIFTVFGTGIGPASSPALAFPLSTTLAGVSIKVTRGDASVDAIPVFVNPTQVNAILPSNAPTGQGQLTVTQNGRTSAPITVQIADSSFGMFTVNQNGMGPGVFQNFNSQTDQPPNSPNRPAKPGQFVTAWGTGLGPISGADNQAPPVGNLPVTVDITVGGKTVTNKAYFGRAPCCAGLDQIVFQVPADAPQGCFVPVVIRANNAPGNVTTLAIDPQGNPCSDPGNPLSRLSVNGGKLGVVELLRLSARLQLDPASASFTNVSVDLGTATFVQQTGGEYSYNPLTSLPPLGSCSVFSAGNINVSGLLGGQLPGIPTGAKTLNAGPALSVAGPKGTQSIPRSSSGAGTYFGVLGGSLPLPGAPNLALFLDPGSYTVQGPGGPDVGTFTLNLPVASPVTWINQLQLSLVDRSQGATLTWTGGDPSSQSITILGGNVDNSSQAGAVFLCLASLGAGNFAVPAAILSSLPPSNVQQPSQSTGFLFLGVNPSGNLPAFTATGIDAGYGFYTQFIGTSTTYK